MKLLGTMLWTLMDYPDRPYGWEHDKEVQAAFDEETEAGAGGRHRAARLPHTVGYWEKPENKQARQLGRASSRPKALDPEHGLPQGAEAHRHLPRGRSRPATRPGCTSR